MIKKLNVAYIQVESDGNAKLELSNKINEIIAALNPILEERESQIKVYEETMEMVKENTRPKTTYNVLTGEMEPKDVYAEQRKWIGKLCWFWDYERDNATLGLLTDIYEDEDDTPFRKDNMMWFEHCEPVMPTDNIIFKG